jgi:hypothetical protein
MAATHKAQARGQKAAFPQRGDICLVGFGPAVESEIQKTSPALVIQNDIGNRPAAVPGRSGRGSQGQWLEPNFGCCLEPDPLRQSPAPHKANWQSHSRGRAPRGPAHCNQPGLVEISHGKSCHAPTGTAREVIARRAHPTEGSA